MTDGLQWSDVVALFVGGASANLGGLAMTGMYGVFPTPVTGLQWMLGLIGMLVGAIGLVWIFSIQDTGKPGDRPPEDSARVGRDYQYW